MLLSSSIPFFVALSGFLSTASAVPTAGTCTEMRLFKEWRDMEKQDQLGYISAVQCLMNLPPKDPSRPDPKSRFDEFQATHIYLTDRVHSVGHFLPWHRHLGTLYGNALRDECGYKGPIADSFWDWTRDADRTDVPLKDSPIFDPVYGFGGDGVPGTYTPPRDPLGGNMGFGPQGCIADGPFKDRLSNLGPGRLATKHCIVRGIQDFWRNTVLSSIVKKVLESKTYEDFRIIVDSFVTGPIHGGGHGIVGGEMLNIYSAGADPLFYLHHANLDRVWWKWQEADKSNRLYAMSGPTEQQGNVQVTLDFVMDFPALGPNVTVRDVMDSRAYPGCFVYDY
ncbi:Di-copper centre-containing protein [Coprinellus micaceus]|uniref:Di-copper centre-containing protein n=1 Tax=Coprinellus micaceus TaxID=71717 RepID=A0A4Y7SFY2_COPMI|nr:Di-copper centre-containing protein [Coprinellus micaceus]